MKTLIYLGLLVSANLLAVSNAAHAEAKTNWYTSTSTCAGNKLIVHSFCQKMDDDELCTGHDLTIVKADGTKIEAGSLEKKETKDQRGDLLTSKSMRCVAGKDNKPYLLLYFANGGNCDECEATGVIDLDGVWKEFGSHWYVTNPEKKRNRLT